MKRSDFRIIENSYSNFYVQRLFLKTRPTWFLFIPTGTEIYYEWDYLTDRGTNAGPGWDTPPLLHFKSLQAAEDWVTEYLNPNEIDPSIKIHQL